MPAGTIVAPTDVPVPLLLGFGYGGTGSFAGTNIDVSGNTGSVAFVLPRDGAVTDIYAYFIAQDDIELDTATGAFHAQLYSAGVTGGSMFTPVPGTDVTLTGGPTTGTIPNGTELTGSLTGMTGTALTAGTRLMLAMYLQTEGATSDITGAGNAYAGVSLR